MRQQLAETLPAVSKKELELSRGFLCASISSLVPGILELWSGVLTSLGEVEVETLMPVVRCSDVWSYQGVASVGNQSVTLYLNADEVSKFFVGTPSDSVSDEIISEYFTRKLFHALSLTYRGLTEELVWDRFDFIRTGIQPEKSGIVIKLRSKKHGAKVSAFIELDDSMVYQIDTEWRRHIQAMGVHSFQSPYAIRLGQITIPSTKLPEFLSGKAPVVSMPLKSDVELVDAQMQIMGTGSLFSYQERQGTGGVVFRYGAAAASVGKNKMIRPGLSTVDVIVGRLSEHGHDIFQSGAFTPCEVGTLSDGRAQLYIHGDKIASAIVTVDQDAVWLEAVRGEA